MKTVKPNLGDYEEYTLDQYNTAMALVTIWEGLGKPQEPFSKTGMKLIDAFIQAWEVTRPDEAYEWKKIRDEYQSSEKTIKEQVKQHTGRNLAALPYLILIFFNQFFPDLDKNREFYMRLVKEYPIFRFVNRV